MKCASANSFEVFVADNALEGGAGVKRRHFDDLELIGESGIREGGTMLECVSANSFEVFVEDNAFEGGAFGECYPFDDVELIGESDTREGVAFLECSCS